MAIRKEQGVSSRWHKSGKTKTTQRERIERVREEREREKERGEKTTHKRKREVTNVNVYFGFL